MTFTYSSTSLTTTLAKVRMEIGDTDSTQVLFTDEELQVYLDSRGTDYLAAAADACDALAARFARSYDFETDGQSFKRSQQSKAYREMAGALRERAGGITTMDITKVDGYSDDILNQTTSTSSSTVNPRRRFYGEEDAIP